MTSRTDRRVSMDRKSWASFYETITEVALVGRGEYLMEEPIMFGRAFTRKPLMSSEISVLQPDQVVGEEVRAWGYPAVTWKDGVEKPQFGTFNSKLPDGSFEMQEAEIPFWDDVETWNVSRGYAFLWMQSPSTPTASENKWWITDERAEPRYGSGYSAKVVLEASTSPWLAPDWEMLYGIVENPNLPLDYLDRSDIDIVGHGGDALIWRGVPSPNIQVHPKYLSSTAQTFYANTYNSDPLQLANWFRVSVWSDAPCDVEFVFATVHEVFDSTVGWTYPSRTEPSLILSYTATNQWQGLEGRIENTWRRYTKPDCYYVDDELLGFVFARVRNGTPGQVVHFDNINMSLDYTTTNHISNLTIGVAEWVRGDKGEYIGAKLWFSTTNEILVFDEWCQVTGGPSCT